MTVRPLTPDEIVARTAALMRRSKGNLLRAAQVLNPQASLTMTKAAFVAILLADAATIEPSPKTFDFSGLTAPRLAVQFQPKEVKQ